MVLTVQVPFRLSIHSRLPIEELFYHGKNIRGHKKEFLATTTTPLPTIIRANSTEAEDEDYDDYDIWDDYFDIPETNQTFSTSTKAPVTKKKGSSVTLMGGGQNTF